MIGNFVTPDGAAATVTEGARVKLVMFWLDEGLRIWPIQSGEHKGKWRVVRVELQHAEPVTQAPFANFHVLQHAHPDAVPGVNDNETVPPGTEGTVENITKEGQVSVRWDNGTRLFLSPRDTVEVLPAARVARRTFEAKKFPKGSHERARLNLDALTSEYMPSYRYVGYDGTSQPSGRPNQQSFRTRGEADAWIERT